MNFNFIKNYIVCLFLKLFKKKAPSGKSFLQNGWSKEESARRQTLYVNYHIGLKRELKKVREFKEADRAFLKENGRIFAYGLWTPELHKTYDAIIDGEHDASVRVTHYRELIDGLVCKTPIPSKEFWFWEAIRDKGYRKGIKTRENKNVHKRIRFT